MFTGIIQRIGILQNLHRGRTHMLNLTADLSGFPLRIGDSVAVNGVCLTLTGHEGSRFSFQLSAETLRISNLSDLAPGSRLNLEMPLTLQDLLGGHLVSGHIDGTARLKSLRRGSDSWRLDFVFQDPEWRKFMITRGSIALNGASLTLAETRSASFAVILIPQTLKTTNLRQLAVGERVNVELDLTGKYIYNQVCQLRK